MQKNRSFQKVNKTSKQISNSSSRALLELSEITCHSKDKSSLLQNFTQRTGYPSVSAQQNPYNELGNVKLKQKGMHKSQSKKQTYLRKNITISNAVLNQIMQMSNSFPIKKLNFESSKQKDNELIILSKNDLQKNKNFSQNKNSKKLLLYENKQNQNKKMSTSKSSIKSIKDQSIMCSIKIHPLQQQKSNQYCSNTYSNNYSNNRKRQSFDGRRSSFSSRRSSIHLFQPDDIQSEVKINQIKKSFLAKISYPNQQNNKNQLKSNQKSDNFLKKSYFDNNNLQNDEQQKGIISKQTCQNEPQQITPRQKKEIKQRYLFKLDELSIVEDDIKRDAIKFIIIWDEQIQSQKNIKRYRKLFNQIKKRYDQLLNQSNKLKNGLFQQNKKYIMNKRMSNNNFNVQKQSILLDVQRIHTQVKKKVFKKDLQDIMIFNMKVVLPSSQMIESSISCFDNNINSTISYSNITILQLYEQLMNQKACKKYGMILKKQINNMNIYDNRTMNQYLKKLYQLQNCFNKVYGQDPQNQNYYLDTIQKLIQTIQDVDQQLNEVQSSYINLDKKIQQNQSIKQKSVINIQSLLSQISQSVFSQYKIFQTGGNNRQIEEIHKYQNSQQINKSFNQNYKTIEQFKQLVTQKYEKLYHRYKQIKQQKRLIIDSLKNI